MDGPERQAKRPRRSATAAEGRLPPEVFAAVGAYCCRSSLDALMCTSKQIRAVCSGLPKPWPTKRGCPLVGMLCPDHMNLPDAQEEPDVYKEPADHFRYTQELQSFTPPPNRLVMLHDSVGPSFLVLQNEGIKAKKYVGHVIKAAKLQVWSRESGLMFEEQLEKYPYHEMKPAVTPPLGGRGSQFLILPVRLEFESPGIRMVKLCKPSIHSAMRMIQTFSLPCNDTVENVKCAGGSEDPCLIFMDRGESAVKLCRITMGEGGGGFPVLKESEIIVSDPSRTGDYNTRRSSLAVDSKRGIIAFSYDFEDTFVNIYDMKRKVSVAVPVPDAGWGVRDPPGWIRDIEFSPDGKMLVVAHCHFRDDLELTGPTCAISMFDCDVERIEDVLQRPPKLFHIREKGYCSRLAFSPKGAMVSFEWHPDAWLYERERVIDGRKPIFERDRAGMIDLSSLKDCSSGDKISIEVLSEIGRWEKFVRS